MSVKISNDKVLKYNSNISEYQHRMEITLTKAF